MTKDFKNKLKDVRYKSISDFSKRIDEIKDMDDKLEFVTEYLLTHRRESDCSLDEAINIARMKITDGIVEYKAMQEKANRINQNESLYSDEEKKNVDLKTYGNVLDNNNLYIFMNEPILYLRTAAERRIQNLNNKLETNDILNGPETIKLSLYENNLEVLDHYKLRLNLEDNELNFLHIDARLDAKFGGAEALDEAFNSTKPGFFSRMFNTTSREGKNLIQAYKDFYDYKGDLYGNKENLENAANAYLKHVFPNFEPGYPLPDKHLIDGLSGTQKTRATLCNAILEAVRAENKITDEYKEAIYSNKEMEFNLNENVNDNQIEIKKTNIIDLDKDLNDSFNESISENNNDEIIEKNELEM